MCYVISLNNQSATAMGTQLTSGAVTTYVTVVPVYSVSTSNGGRLEQITIHKKAE